MARIIAFDLMYWVSGEDMLGTIGGGIARSAPIPAALYQRVGSHNNLVSLSGAGGIAADPASVGGSGGLIAVPLATDPLDVNIQFGVDIATARGDVAGVFIGTDAASGKRLFVGVVAGNAAAYAYPDGVTGTQLGANGSAIGIGTHTCVAQFRHVTGTTYSVTLLVDGTNVLTAGTADLGGTIGVVGIQMVAAVTPSATAGYHLFGPFLAVDVDDSAPTRPLIVWKGDSTIEGTALSSPGPNGTQSPPSDLARLLTGYDIVNIGRGGQATGLARTDVALPSMVSQVAEIDALYQSSRSKNILVIEGGINDLYEDYYVNGSNTITGSTIQGYIESLIAGLTNSWTVFVMTQTPTGPSATQFGPNANVIRDARNVLTRSRAAIVRYTAIDIAADPNIGPDSAPTDTTFYLSDETHQTARGASIIAGIVAEAINPQPYYWFVLETNGGSIDSAGNYTAPETPGTYHVAAVKRADPTQVGVSLVEVS